MTRVEQIGAATLTAIYALCEYPSWEPRYVGKTTQWIHERHKAHIRAAKRGQRLPVHYWLRKRIAANEWLAVKLLEFVEPGADWAARERDWIDRLRGDGANLLNLTAGGEGLPGHKFAPEHKQKIAAALRRGATFQCVRCSASFWRKPHEIKSGYNKFCSRQCSNEHNKGGRRAA